jgi:SHS2 domain-containing protein
MMARPFVEIEHTADLALRVWGADLPALFTHAAQGMFHLMRCPPSTDETRSVAYEIALCADDLETLLVDWLGELLYLAQRDAACLERYEFAALEGASLQATASGRAPRHPARAIKAVTYADLAIRRVSDGYETIVTFDV